MSSPLYRERQAGPAPSVHNELPDHTKRGVLALLTGALGSDQLGNAFPEHCRDGNGVCGTNRVRAVALIEALVPGLEWPPRQDVEDGMVFDLIEFFAARVAEPKNKHWHSFYSHYELEFDQPAGSRQFRDDVNGVLAAGGTVYQLHPAGRIERIGTPEVRAALTDLRPNSGDTTVDSLIIEARRRYLSTSDSDRQLGLEKLWDAFERLKTIEDGKHKRAQVEELLQHVEFEQLRAEVEAEMLALTKIGNNFQIRHYETSKHPLPDSKSRDYLFARLSNLIIFLLKASNRLDP